MSSSSQSLLPAHGAGVCVCVRVLQQAFSNVSQVAEKETHHRPWLLPPGTLKGWPAVASDTSTNLVSLLGFLSTVSEGFNKKSDLNAILLLCKTFYPQGG